MSDNATTEKNVAVKSRKAPVTKKKRAPRKKASKSPAATSRENMAAVDENVIMLDPVLVINNATMLHSTFAPFLDSSSKEIVIDASSVEMLDTAIAQLIYSFVSALKSSGRIVIWRSPSGEFAGRIKSLGLAEFLGI